MVEFESLVTVNLTLDSTDNAEGVSHERRTCNCRGRGKRTRSRSQMRSRSASQMIMAATKRLSANAGTSQMRPTSSRKKKRLPKAIPRRLKESACPSTANGTSVAGWPLVPASSAGRVFGGFGGTATFTWGPRRHAGYPAKPDRRKCLRDPPRAGQPCDDEEPEALPPSRHPGSDTHGHPGQRWPWKTSSG